MNAKQANRAARRAAEQRKPKALRGTEEELKARFAKNGITQADLEAAEQRGIQKGIEIGIRGTYKGFYAAILLTAHE